MKFLRQFFIIIIISFVGELLKYLIPVNIPASIYGLIIMLTLLRTGVLKLNQVRDTGYFLIEIMPIMFVPAAVGLIETWGVFKPIFLPVLFIALVSTVLVMGISAKVTELVIEKSKGDR